MHTILIEDYGAFLGKKGDRFIVRKAGKVVGEFPASQVERIVISSSGASVSSSALYLAVTKRITVMFTYSSGAPFAFLTPTQGHGSVHIRRAQYREAGSERGLTLAKAFVCGKLQNQRCLLNVWAKSRTRTNPELSDRLFQLATDIDLILEEIGTVSGPLDTAGRELLMNAEGRAASSYWEGVAGLLPPELGFPGRHGRGASDPFNMMLNYGYGILYSQVWSAINTAGLDPFAGFLHTDRPGRVSLALDLIEEFRQQVVDRVLVHSLTGKELKIETDVQPDMLSKSTREAVASRVVNRLSERVQVRESKVELRNVIVRQAWSIARFLCGESARYEPFYLRW